MLVEVTKFGWYYLNIKEVLESWNQREHFQDPPPSPFPPPQFE